MHKLFILSLLASSVAVQAKQIERTAPLKFDFPPPPVVEPYFPDLSQYFDPEPMSVHLITEQATFDSLGITPQEMGRYIGQSANLFRELFTNINKRATVALKVEITSVASGEECKADYKKCVLMKVNIEAKDTDLAALEEFKNALLKLDEVQIKNFNSKDKAVLVVLMRSP